MSIWSDMEDRSAGDIVRKEDDNWDGLHFVITDKSDCPEKGRIKEAALASFTFGGFTSLDDMLYKLRVKLV